MLGTGLGDWLPEAVFDAAAGRAECCATILCASRLAVSHVDSFVGTTGRESVRLSGCWLGQYSGTLGRT